MRQRASEFVGILGWPLSHTLSPIIHAAAFREVGLDWVYLRFEVPPDELPSAVAGLRALGAMGGNVTMPHKGTVVPHLDDVSGDARVVGAVNTIQRVGDRLVGHNTDVDGFRELVTGDAGFDPAGRSALVLGSGGAARAVVKALDELGVSEIRIAARAPEKAGALTDLASTRMSTPASWADAPALASSSDLVVNCTPVGMDGGDVLPGARWREGQVVFDLVYDPPTTPLLEGARRDGIPAWGGLGMLVHQAAAAFRIWTGQEAPIETMSAAALHATMRLHADDV